MSHPCLKLFRILRIMSNPFRMLKKKTSLICLLPSFSFSSPATPYPPPFWNTCRSTSVLFYFVCLFLTLQCLCTCSFCLDCLPTYFWPLIGELFSILYDLLSMWSLPWLNINYYLFPLLHTHTCIMAHSSLHYKCLFICLSLWPVFKFLECWTMADPSYSHTLFSQHYTHSRYSGMLFKWIISIFDNLKNSSWTRLTSELQQNYQLFNYPQASGLG